jgi:hypothetical protein
MKFLWLLSLIPQIVFGKTLIFTTAFNRPDFIEWQHRLLTKFMRDEYEYVVFSDANTNQSQAAIQKVCDELGVRCIAIPQDIHTRPYLTRQSGDNLQQPNIRNCNAVQWAWDHYIVKHDGPVLLIDSDMFPIRPFSAEEILKDHDLAYVCWSTSDLVSHQNYDYMWIALICFNMNTLPSPNTICFNCGFLPGTNAVVDSGGWTHLYLQKYRQELRFKDISFVQGHHFYCPYRYGSPPSLIPPNEEIITNLTKRGFPPQEIEFVLEKPDTIELLFDNHFLHYRCGTNYEQHSAQHLNKKDQTILSFFNKILLAQ